MENLNQELINFLNKSHSEFNVVENEVNMLLEANFIQLKEEEKWNLELGKNYFVERNGNALIAFKLPKKIDDLKFAICASHTDSPTFKIKHNPSVECANCEKLKLEPYGGMIKSVWFDKPLSLAGRIVVKKGENVYAKVVDVDKDLMIIPNVAIHQKRDINEGLTYNNEVDLMPILGDSGENLFNKILSMLLEKDEEILSHDLYLYNREKANFLGVNDDYICGAKLDDTAANFISLKAFINSKNEKNIGVLAGFDNEETGSMSYSGADSNFLDVVLKRIVLGLGQEVEDLFVAEKKSFMLSIDNGHAMHPNRPELSDTNHPVLLNKGVVLKYNSNMLYTTDALSSGIVKEFAKKGNVPLQEFYNRADVRGGSTLGNISMKHVSILTADIGLAQLSMHSNYETMGAKDSEYLYSLCKTFLESDFELGNNSFKIN